MNARLANEGYTRTRRNDNNILYGVNWKMDWLTKGLSANARIAYSTIDEVFRKVNRGKDAYPTYHYDPTTDQYNINPNRKYAYSQYALTAGTNQAVKNLDVRPPSTMHAYSMEYMTLVPRCCIAAKAVP